MLVEDKALHTANLSHSFQAAALHHRKQTLRALLKGVPMAPHLAFMNEGAILPAYGEAPITRERPWLGAGSVCFDVVVQKTLAFSGDPYSAALLRGRVYDSCDIAHSDGEPTRLADTVLILNRGDVGTRRWHNLSGIIESLSQRPRLMRRSHCGRKRCGPLTIRTQEMGKLSYCEQVGLFARSRLVIAHHGAAVVNGLYLPPYATMVEVNKQWESDKLSLNALPDRSPNGIRWARTFHDAFHGPMFGAAGAASYIGARVAYGVWPRQQPPVRCLPNVGKRDLHGVVHWRGGRTPCYDMHDARMEVALNQSRWKEIVDEIEAQAAGALADER